MTTRDFALSAATLVLCLAGAQAQTTGTSHPEDLDDTITTMAPPPARAVMPPAAKPSPDVPLAANPPLAVSASATTSGAPGPQSDSGQNASVQSTSSHYVPPYDDAADAGSSRLNRRQAGVETARADNSFVVTNDPNSGVVIDVPSAANQLPEGTLLRASLQTEISTQDSVQGAAFRAQITQNVLKLGKVAIPAGSILSGRISQLHGGHRIGGAASIRLDPQFVTLPGGSTYRLDAQVIDLARGSRSHVSDEGAIVGNDHSKGTMAAYGLTTASAAAAGAVVAGPVGLVVGAGVGAGVDTVFWLKHENQQTLAPGTLLVFNLNAPMLLEPVSN